MTVDNNNKNDDDDQNNDENDEENQEMAAVMEEQDGYATGDDGDDDETHTSHREESAYEPDDSKVSAIPFGKFCCHRLEAVWKKRREKKSSRRMKDSEKLEALLPREKMLNQLNGQTIYPWLRLILPDQDSQRSFLMKERKIADAYCKAFGFGKGTRNFEMLYNFTDPEKVPPEVAGDLSLVVEHVLKQRIPSGFSPVSVTIGKINEMLDELANIRVNAGRGKAHHNHQWRESQSQQANQSTNDNNSKEKRETDATLRGEWLTRVKNVGLGPTEHKWLVRILLKKMEIGVGCNSVLKWYSPYALELW
jgi:DNA ligase-4